MSPKNSRNPGPAVSPARRAAYDALVEVARDEATGLEQALDRLAVGLEDRDRRLAFEIALGTTRHRAWLESVLAGYLRKPLGNQGTVAHEALLAALFQLGWLDRVPDFAVVSDTVSYIGSSREVGALRGLANGVLRNVLRQGKQTLRPAADAPWTDRLSVPRQLAQWFEGYFGRDTSEAFFTHSMTRAPICVRPRGEAEPPEGAEPSPVAPGVFRLGDGAAPRDLTQRTDLVIQDEGAALACAIASDGIEPHRVLDACAAPGGKTVWLADRFPDARIVAWEHSPARRGELRANIERFGLGDRVSVPDTPPAAEELFDLVLVDAPCTGFGTLRRHPEIKNRRGEDDARRLSSLQGRLLEQFCEHVAPGGVIAYTVCTVMRQEGERVAIAFSGLRGVFQPAASGAAPAGSESDHGVGMWRLMPHELDCDGYFIARWRKTIG